ncbi:SAM-dependent methyltransferase [Cryptosporangium phraense]|uniref:Methyltransferase domain-containing protein n=1 Tax=Cryptosporangium phraense TaxID=2593070 RepID=A0A545ALK8_9ACTN|nr:SAM-dependent methyltransferase [Cryptosporangium phraense]TQS42196.1 methyltransferase domain-containing protein [Cryptosporangium phraense]
MSLPTEYFDEMYRADGDPWKFETRWYEERKYALTLAALPRRRYRSAFEPGCSIGVLSAALAPRCDALLSTDVAAKAVAATRARVPAARVEQRRIPEDFPDGPFDLIVLSEVGYYLDSGALARLVDATVAALEPGGDLVLVHWRHPVADYPLDGDTVHDAFAGRPELERTVAHVEDDFRLEVYARTPPAARSVAAAEGLC